MANKLLNNKSSFFLNTSISHLHYQNISQYIPYVVDAHSEKSIKFNQWVELKKKITFHSGRKRYLSVRFSTLYSGSFAILCI